MNRLQKYHLLCWALAPDLSPRAVQVNDKLSEQLFTDTFWPELVSMAGEGLVTPSLAGALERCELISQIPPDARQYLEGMQQLNGQRNAILCEELNRVAAWLNEIGIEPLLLKGAICLVGSPYPGSDDRVIGDLDLLVPEDRIDEAFDYIQQGGFKASEHCLDQYRQNHHHVPPILHDSRPVTVELHRHLCQDSLRNLVPADKFLEHSTELEWRGCRLRLPGPADQVMHTIVHAQLQDHGYDRRFLRLRRLLEFAWQATSMAQDIEWGELDERLRRADSNLPHRAWQAWWYAAQDLFGVTIPSQTMPVRATRIRHRITLYPKMSWSIYRFTYWLRRIKRIPRKLLSLSKLQRSDSGI